MLVVCYFKFLFCIYHFCMLQKVMALAVEGICLVRALFMIDGLSRAILLCTLAFRRSERYGENSGTEMV